MTTERQVLNPPATMLGAFGCWLASVAIGVITAVVALTERQTLIATMKDAAAKAGNTMSDAQLNSAATVAIGFLVGASIVFAALYLWLAFKLRAGRNWARVTLTVLAVLHLGTLFAQGSTTWSYVDTVIQVVAVVLSFLPPSNAYVTARKMAP
jgi:hypothetical protein